MKPWQRDRNCPGMRKAQGRHCTGTGRGAAQSEGSALHRLRHTHKTKGFAEIERCAVTARGVARGTPAALHGQCHACIEKRPNPLCLLLVISSTFFATRGRRDS